MMSHRLLLGGAPPRHCLSLVRLLASCGSIHVHGTHGYSSEIIIQWPRSFDENRNCDSISLDFYAVNGDFNYYLSTQDISVG